MLISGEVDAVTGECRELAEQSWSCGGSVLLFVVVLNSVVSLCFAEAGTGSDTI